jgi:hypothetical protein
VNFPSRTIFINLYFLTFMSSDSQVKTRMKYSTFILLLLCICANQPFVLSNPYFDNNSNIRLAHQDLYSLRLMSAEQLLQSEEFRNPDNGYITFYRLYSDIIALTISNSPEEFKKKILSVNLFVKKLKELPDNGPDYRLLLGEAYVYTGLINVKYDSKFSGLIDCLKGYRILEENAKKYPLFEPNNKILGIIQIGVAFMPKMLQWGIKLFNINSNPSEGLKKLSGFSEFARGKPGYEEEAFLFTMAAHRLMNQEDAAMKLINEDLCNFKESAILNLIAATVCLQANDAETALTLLSNITPGKLEIDFPQVQYLKAKAKLMRLDKDSDIALKAYLNTSSGNDYIKTILYDLACFYYISGNKTEYFSYLEKVKDKQRGREFLSRDIEAAFEARKPDIPNIYLMRADFLIRGGYFRQAEDELFKVNRINDFKECEKVQYYFLRGECFRLRNLVRQAESEYLNAVDAGKSSGNYISQKALVNSGLMMEKNNFNKEAEKYYNLCLQYKAVSNPYTDFYKNKARAGLIRLSLPQ